MVPSQNLVQCIEDIHHNKSTKLERPGKMRRGSRSDQSDFFE